LHSRRRPNAAVTALAAFTVAALVLPVGSVVGHRPAMGNNQPNALIDPPDID